MTRQALVIGCGGTIGGAWAVAALSALCAEIGCQPADFDILQGTSAGAEMVTRLGGGASVNDLVAMHRGTVADARLRSHLAEFRDHELIRVRAAPDGGELMAVPMDDALLRRVLAELDAEAG